MPSTIGGFGGQEMKIACASHVLCVSCDDDRSVLNGAKRSSSSSTAPKKPLAERLRLASLKIQAAWIADGREVDYSGLQSSPEWAEFLDITSELSSPESGEELQTSSCLEAITEEGGQGEQEKTPKNDAADDCSRPVMPFDENERKAFLINLYNVLMMHGLIHHGLVEKKHPIQAAQAAGKKVTFFDDIAYEIDGQRLSLDDIEHGLLRGNAKKRFETADPRFWWVLPLDPRIHFALVCGAKGCPAIQVYSAANLERGLESAARTFLRGETQMTVGPFGPEGEPRLGVATSMLFKWYGDDFGLDDEERIAFIASYLEDEKREKILAAAAGGGEQAPALIFNKYDWSLNTGT
ncbi:unnamed protein product [Amoebophrya sp. A25]|nr:unnamed protein product [Amoebophrya sp. A25]|eukprot:GSA25T00015260001.1